MNPRPTATASAKPGEPAAADAALLYTPAQAARLLSVPESWLRKRAGQRLIPCTFLGKHLRFSRRDLTAIADAGARLPRPTTIGRRNRCAGT
ncbi:helix-turn-helix domain-containing protein [Jatrophihabitans lederbergiae]|uniref:Helix-turn-helix domain-containing protein n=1 Tax=Jatrophihabitans lederbergiae TaxID=3075547 RepID=A0ABU2JFU6_9ACTN|nr:helix-turn-helix domain-containing protein [Jatrophihabitans sp. DSM 44399]MDT0263108.1 helix-turn-helix domain-containing protein [Jatrophihabitans sp. DSM 44399]